MQMHQFGFKDRQAIEEAADEEAAEAKHEASEAEKVELLMQHKACSL